MVLGYRCFKHGTFGILIFPMRKILIVLGIIISIFGFCAAPHSVLAATKKTPAKKTVVVKKTVKKVVKKAPKVIPNPRVAKLLISSATELRLQPGESVQMRLGFKNIGTVSWNKLQLRADGPDVATLQNDSWAGAALLAAPTGSEKIGSLTFFDFKIVAPDQPGSYFLSGTLYADGKEVVGGTFGVPVEVALAESGVIPIQLKAEPNIRVALGTIDGGALIRTIGDYDFVAPDGSSLLSIPDGSKFLWQYDIPGKTYLITMNGVATSSPDLFRLKARTLDGRFVIHDRADSPKWNKSISYNDFRGNLELRWSDKMIGLWVINELPFEQYLKGLIETGSGDPLELQKAVDIAARSYAYVLLPDGKSYPNRLWDVHAVWDQVYKGYAAEKTNPMGVQAVDATRGMIVAFQGRPVVTPYFTRSDGSTRSWKQVWGGTDKPWLQPVDALYDHGKTLWGHGVGMSVTDAKMRIKKDGWTYDQVLKYYYTGVDIRQVFG